MEIRHLDRDQLGPENGYVQRLVPWDALNAPFEGAWCLIRPGTSSPKHAHHEYEIFIAVRGEALVEANGERRPFRVGDIVHFTPGTEHQVINEGSDGFEFYAVWWDQDMTSRFTARHHEPS